MIKTLLGWVTDLLARAASFAAFFFWSRSKSKVKNLEAKNEALENKAKVAADISKLTPLAKRKLLDKWARDK